MFTSRGLYSNGKFIKTIDHRRGVVWDRDETSNPTTGYDTVPLARASARIAPVDVPAAKSKYSTIDFLPPRSRSRRSTHMSTYE